MVNVNSEIAIGSTEEVLQEARDLWKLEGKEDEKTALENTVWSAHSIMDFQRF